MLGSWLGVRPWRKTFGNACPRIYRQHLLPAVSLSAIMLVLHRYLIPLSAQLVSL